MNLRGVLFLLGRLLLALAAALLVPAVVSFWLGGPDLRAFLVAALVTLAAGAALERGFRQRDDFAFGRREAFVLVTAAWVTASIAGALPYVFFKGAGFAIDGLFEAASGFTTTGASVLTNVEGEPAGILLWRSLTHWLGGMGIIVLGIAILPKLAVGGMELLGAEAPGPIAEKLTPRIAQTAKALWAVYAVITLAEVLVLKLLGMDLFDAVNHAFATMATGGFSTRNLSVGAYGSAAIEIVVAFFMMVAGANFALHYRLLRGDPAPLVRDPEFRAYVAILGIATVAIAIDLALARVAGPLDSLRLAWFQSTTVVTTTGFATADFDAWPQLSRAVLFVLMFVGGCAGSTGGSVKVVRILIVVKKLGADLKALIRPHAVLPVRIGHRAVPPDVVGSVTTFFILFLTLFAIGGLLLTAMGLDLVSAFSASAACLGNIGPGFGAVGPTQTYAPLPGAGKLVLAFLMIVGRLEIYTVLVVLFLGRKR